MAARRGPRLSRGRVNNRSVALKRDPGTGLLVATEATDGPPPERALRQGGLEEGYRVMPGGAVVRGVWAKATGVFEAIAAAGLLGPDPDTIRRRQDAAEALRRLVGVAQLYRSPTGRWGFQTAGGPAEETERAARARRVLGQRAQALGWDRMQLLLDILVMDQIPARAALDRALEALDAYAAVLRLAPARAPGPPPGRADGC